MTLLMEGPHGHVWNLQPTRLQKANSQPEEISLPFSIANTTRWFTSHAYLSLHALDNFSICHQSIGGKAATYLEHIFLYTFAKMSAIYQM